MIAEKIGLTRAALRPDLAVLSMCDILGAKPKVGYFTSTNIPKRDLVKTLMKIKLGDIMSSPVVIDESASVYESIVRLFMENIGTLFVADNHVLKGIVSRKDLLKVAMNGGDMSNMPIGIAMTSVAKAIYLDKDNTIIDAAEKIIECDIDCIPIVEFNEFGHMIIIGRVSKTNITRAILDIVGNETPIV